MAEQVQQILERMVPPLKDLRDRQLFSPDEIRSIVARRRQSEYLLQRRGGNVKRADYLRYIEEEVLLERLRKLRKEKVLRDWKERRESSHGNNHDGNNGDNNDEYDANGHKKTSLFAYQTSGPGDSHILQHIHFLYQRLLRKFHYPVDLCLNYAEFAKENASFHHLSRIYAEALQHHPREEGLWIEAASFEFFGFVSRDYDDDENDPNGVVNSKVVGSSIRNARVLMQRGLRINGKTSEELWIQYFALELHYVQKLRGRKEILELGLDNDKDGDGEDDDVDDDDDDETSSSSGSENESDNGHGNNDDDDNGSTTNTTTKNKRKKEKKPIRITNTMLVPCQIIYKNAIKAIPNNTQFRLRFIETCRMFPQTKCLERYVMETVECDFGTSVEAWVARISYGEEELKRRWRVRQRRGLIAEKDANMEEEEEEETGVGFLAKVDRNEEEEEEEEEEEGRPSKKSRVDSKTINDASLSLLQQALEAVPTSKMYLEGARFLRMRIQRLLDHSEGKDKQEQEEGEEEGDGISHLLGQGEDPESVAQRHADILEEIYVTAKEKGASSPNLTLDHVDFLLSSDKPAEAEALLSDAIATITATANATASAPSIKRDNARLWLRWADLAQRMVIAGLAPSLSPANILRRALKQTPIHEREAHLMMLTELMKCLMVQSQSDHGKKSGNDELKLLFQQLLLLSQGSIYSIADESQEEEDDEKVNLAAIFLAYMKYAILRASSNISDSTENDNAIRSIYTGVVFHSNYGKSCAGKANEEIFSMKSFFDACLEFEMASPSTGVSKKEKNKEKKRKRKRQTMTKLKKERVCKLYEAAVSFFQSGGGNSYLGNVADEYQRGLQDVKYGF